MDCYSPQCKAAAAQATRKLQLKIKVMKFKKFWLLVVVVVVVVVLEVDKGPQDHKLGGYVQAYLVTVGMSSCLTNISACTTD